MPTFTFDPYASSDPPSTPERRSTQSHPSTTPAGPPPPNKGLPSFTPKGPPPSSAFGSSLQGTGKQAFSITQPSNTSSKPLFPSRNGNPSVSFGNVKTTRLPSSPPQPIVIDDESEDDEDEDDEMEENDDGVEDSLANISPGFNPFHTSTRLDPFAQSAKKSTFQSSTRQSTRSNGYGDLDIHGFAKGLAAANGTATLDDPDELIFETERIAQKLGGGRGTRPDSPALAEIAAQLRDLWNSFGGMERSDVEAEGIGPVDENAKLQRADFLASLALALHYPPSSEQRRNGPSPAFNPRGTSRGAHLQEDANSTPMPKVLLDWINAYHDPAVDSIEGVLEIEGGYSASPAYWDAIFLSLTRCKFDKVLELLRGSNFEVAEGPEGGDARYSTQQLQNINKVVNQAIQLIQACPAVRNGDWDIKGADWTIFRHRVELAQSSLRDFSEGDSKRELDALQSSRFGRSTATTGFDLSRAGQRAESKVPFEIYEPLQDMYNQLLGIDSDILKSSFDWVEAVFALTVWWDGEDNEAAKGSLAASRRSLKRVQQTRQVDITPALAYRQQLKASFRRVMDDEELKGTFDTTDPIQLGLACVLQGDTEGLLGLLQSWSMPIATALAEVANAGGWLSEEAGTRESVENFDQSDLMVLSYGQPTKTNKKDELLAQYANVLSEKEKLTIPTPNTEIEGWQLALRVLGRLEDAESAQTKVATLLDGLRFTSNEQVDHVLELCNDLGFNQHAMSITEKYADSIAESTHRYGDSLLYYTRSHKFQKAKNVIDVLISTSLIMSTSYPPFKDLDDRLRSFVTAPMEILSGLANVDYDAAEKLSTWLSGYATLRKFYDLRDEDTNLKRGEKATHQPRARKKFAAEALLAVVSSSGDSIRGGLLDPSVEVVVPVDALLVLLGEALPLLNQTPRILTVPQLFTLLKAVEDLQTIGPRIYAGCESEFQAALDNVYGGEVPSPRGLLRKETSNMTGSSQFSMVGSSLLSSKEMGTVASDGSGVLVNSGEIKRGWDWRKGLRKNATGEDVLRVVRLSLSQEVAKAWADGEDRV